MTILPLRRLSQRTPNLEYTPHITEGTYPGAVELLVRFLSPIPNTPS